MSDRRPFGPHVDADDGEWAKLGQLARSDLNLAWTRLRAIAATVDDSGLYWVGDIIEDLISQHGWDFVPRLETALATDQRLRRAFTEVVPRHSDRLLADRLLTLREQIEGQLAREGSDPPTEGPASDDLG